MAPVSASPLASPVPGSPPKDPQTVIRPAREGTVRVLKAAAAEFVGRLRMADRELSVLVVTDRAIRALNKQWRAKDKATDVLSFGLAASRKPRAARPEAIGDVVISLDTARRQAREGGWTLRVELRRLLAHGLLHCLGHDHEAAGQAKRMARAERSLLGEEGMVGAAFSTGLKSGPRSRSF